MKVAIIGPGAMGCLFAVRLAQSGTETVLADHRTDRAARLRQTGITVEEGGRSLTARPEVVLRAPSGQDLIIVLTKAYSTADLNLPTDAPVLTLQNGLGNVEMLCAKVGSSNVIAGATSESSTLLAEGRVRHTASGLTWLGSWTSCATQVAEEILKSAGFQVEVTEAPGQMIWEKVAINAGVNPLTALLNVPNGELLKIPEVRQLMRDLVVEAVKVASVEGYRFDHSIVEKAEEMCRQTKDNISSMLQDVRAGKKTEIEAISGEILRRAQAVSLPSQRTRVVWQLVKGLESR